jgi:hypothetical protein
LPVVFDSASIAGIADSLKNATKIDSSEIIQFVDIPEAEELYEGKRKYFFYPLYRMDSRDFDMLFYYSSTNPDIPFDATIHRIYLATYNDDQSLVSFLLVGLIDLQFDYENYLFSTVSKDFHIKSIKTQIKTNEDDMEKTEVLESRTISIAGEIRIDGI